MFEYYFDFQKQVVNSWKSLIKKDNQYQEVYFDAMIQTTDTVKYNNILDVFYEVDDLHILVFGYRATGKTKIVKNFIDHLQNKMLIKPYIHLNKQSELNVFQKLFLNKS